MGVAITPIDTPSSSMIFSSSSVCCTGIPATGFPAIAGSASINAATRKPREANPP